MRPGSLEDALQGADACFCCAPVGALNEQVEAALATAGPDCVVSDVGSVKGGLVSRFGDERFVGGHPVAGAETSGVEHARADLFEDAAWYLTPSSSSSGILYERLHRLVKSLGARPVAIDAAEHDRLLAAVSHLPHVLANVLVAQAAGRGELPRTGPSFRDATRVAGANSAVWTDIYMANSEAIAAEIDAAAQRLADVAASLRAGDPEGVTAWNDSAAADRRASAGGRPRRRGGGRAAPHRAQPPRYRRAGGSRTGQGRCEHRGPGAGARPRHALRGHDAVDCRGAEADRARALIEDLGFPVA